MQLSGALRPKYSCYLNFYRFRLSRFNRYNQVYNQVHCPPLVFMYYLFALMITWIRSVLQPAPPPPTLGFVPRIMRCKQSGGGVSGTLVCVWALVVFISLSVSVCFSSIKQWDVSFLSVLAATQKCYWGETEASGGCRSVWERFTLFFLSFPSKNPRFDKYTTCMHETSHIYNSIPKLIKYELVLQVDSSSWLTTTNKKSTLVKVQ